LFASRTGLTFDALAPAEVLANHTVSFILNPDRASRLVQHHARETSQPSLEEVMDRLISKTWKSPSLNGFQAEIQRSVNYVVMYTLMSLGSSDRTTPQVRAIATLKLSELRSWLATESKSAKDQDQRAQYLFAVSEIERYLQDPKKVSLPRAVETPPGQPIGDFGFECDWD
jgi:hypothetical protein